MKSVSTGKRKSSSSAPEHEERPDIRAVARLAKVSIATVSRVMNHMPTVDPKLRDKVWEVVKRLGYVPNTQARALGSGRSRLFGVIISDITNPFFPELIQGFEEKAVEIGYETLIGSTRRSTTQMESCIHRMLERKVDGVAVMTFGIGDTYLQRLTAHGIPMVFVDVAPPGDRISAISIDYERGIQEAVQHLAVLGHRRIAFISGPGDLHSAMARKQAFLTATTALGLHLPKSYLFEGDHTADTGMLGMESFLKLKIPPTAVMCSNDMTAIGVMHTASRAGLQVPRDLSVIGFDDIHLARYMLPPLTSIRMSRLELASAAVLSLKAHVDRLDGIAPVRPMVETKLIVRQTTAIPGGSLADLEDTSSRARKSPASTKKRGQ